MSEDCRARPGYYTDGLPKISDKIVGKALEAFWSALWLDDFSDADGVAFQRTLRAALESVLPDIERPLREQIKWLEDRAVPAVEAKLVETKAKLAERDKEIERLREEIGTLRTLRMNAELEVRDLKAKLAERTFSSAEINALLKLASEGDDGYLSDKEYVALESAMATLEKMRDE